MHRRMSTGRAAKLEGNERRTAIAFFKEACDYDVARRLSSNALKGSEAQPLHALAVTTRSVSGQFGRECWLHRGRATALDVLRDRCAQK